MQIVPQAQQMLAEVDGYCRRGDLLTLTNLAEVTLPDWTLGW